MKRGAVFIGVDRAGDLPELVDAAAGAARLQEEWFVRQKLGPSILLTDLQKPVSAEDVQTAIEQLLKPGNLDQLSVFFSGHGTLVRGDEFWLLSDAPRRTQAAVNVSGSEYLARYVGVPHIVFISDCCRTAASTLGLQHISGVDVFPNEQLSEAELPVDRFFSCSLGRAAFEVTDVNESSRQFTTSLYTGVLSTGLCFRAPDAVEWVKESGEDVGYVRPRRLRDFVRDALPRRIGELGLQNKLRQSPDARICSEPDAWLARQAGARPETSSPGKPIEAWLASPASGDLSSMDERQARPASLARLRASWAISNANQVKRQLGVIAPEAPRPFESRCGFEVRGTRVRKAWALKTSVRDFRESDGMGRIEVLTPPSPDALVLLVLESGEGVMLPAIPELIAVLTVVEGELIDVAYEPSDHPREEDVRILRTAIAEATLWGSLSLSGGDAVALAARAQSLQVADPSLSVYAAHGLDQLHRRELIQQLDRFLEHRLGASLFDVSMLSGRLNRRDLSQRPAVFGIAPLLAQGWATLRGRGVRLPQGCDDLHTMLTQSLWTTFTPEGVTRLQSTVFRGATPWALA